jgi:hypothetical protein
MQEAEPASKRVCLRQRKISINSLIVMVQDKKFITNSVVPFCIDITKLMSFMFVINYFKYFNTIDIAIGLDPVLILKGMLFWRFVTFVNTLFFEAYCICKVLEWYQCDCGSVACWCHYMIQLAASIFSRSSLALNLPRTFSPFMESEGSLLCIV